MIKIKKGLNLPLSGEPRQEISSGPVVKSVALLGDDFIGMKPSMLVNEGEKVLKGQALFEDKKTPGVKFTSPVAGTVRAINRGDKRVFKSIVISITGDEQVDFSSYKKTSIANYSASEVRALLVESGMWSFLRTRPFSKTPQIDVNPSSIFVTVTDTRPLAPNPEIVLEGQIDDFHAGVEVLAKLAPKVYVVTGTVTKVNIKNITGVIHETISGPHPAGNVGTHIHHLDPVSASKTVWHVNYQDLAAIGYLFKTGRYSNRRVISIAGPMATNPRLVQTIRGACISDLVSNETKSKNDVRFISGSVLGGRTSKGEHDFLGAFHHQVSLIKEGHYREFLGWQAPGANKFSLKRVVLGSFFPGKTFKMDTSTNGSLRSIVPIGSFEAVMPMDILPTQLLRFMMARNTDLAANLGALELDEEDLALCTFVDPCKNEYGPVLREILNTIEKEG